ncbi:hypothetical protein GCM10009554_43660 [Kribbella koreensis]|uniref:Uncharacterized protein n=1 Tax=Kribbella koreensis TaxID=57909 RepID=A0ABN1QT83_9ACTN
MAESVGTLFDAASTGELTRATTAGLITGGRVDLLIGQPEGAWLDVKSVETDEGDGLVIISLPAQEEDLKPFLVHGAIVNGKIEGRALLRRDHIPPEP